MRLVTRADLDGLACAVLITSCESIEEVQLVHPQDMISIRVQPGPTSEHAAATVGHSIFTRTSRTHVGELMAGFGGGGHRGAGSCLLLESTAEEEIALMIDTMKRDG